MSATEARKAMRRKLSRDTYSLSQPDRATAMLRSLRIEMRTQERETVRWETATYMWVAVAMVWLIDLPGLWDILPIIAFFAALYFIMRYRKRAYADLDLSVDRNLLHHWRGR